MSESAGLKKKYVKQVPGALAVEEEGQRIFALSSFPDASVAAASASLIDKHENAHPVARILKQRQYVKVVPIASVAYDYKEGRQVGSFFVYGPESERRVYFKEYPNRICYLCSVA